MRKKVGKDDIAPVIDEPEVSGKSYRKNWVQLIRKIYETDPLICPKCKSEMRVIVFIEQPQLAPSKDILDAYKNRKSRRVSIF